MLAERLEGLYVQMHVCDQDEDCKGAVDFSNGDDSDDE